MNARRIILLMVFVPAMCVGYTIGHARPGTDTILTARLAEWRKRCSNFDSTRYTLVSTMTLQSCTPCAISAINTVLNDLDEKRFNVNRIVVIATGQPKEGVALRKKFRPCTVVEENDTRLFSELDAGIMSPDAFLLDPSGAVVYHRVDLPRHPLDDGEIAKIHTRFDLVRHLRATSVVPLDEDDDHIVSLAQSVDVDPDRHALRLLDTRNSLLLTFDAITGKRLGEGVVLDSLRFAFRGPGADTSYWNELAEDYSQMVKIDGVVRSNRFDATTIIVELFTGYSIAPRPGGGTTLSWEKGVCLIKLDHDRIVAVHRLPPSEYYPIGTLVQTKSDIVTPTLWEGALTEHDSVPLDSLFLFLAIDSSGSHVHPTVPVRGIVPTAASPSYRPTVLGNVCMTASGAVFYLSRINRIFVRCTQTEKGLTAQRLPIGGLMDDLDFPQPEFTHEMTPTSSSPRLSDSLGVLDLREAGDGLVLLAVDKRSGASNAPLIIQTYSDKGAFTGVFAIEPGIQDDQLLAGYLAGSIGNDLYILTKWQKARWQVLRLDRNSFESHAVN